MSNSELKQFLKNIQKTTQPVTDFLNRLHSRFATIDLFIKQHKETFIRLATIFNELDKRQPYFERIIQDLENSEFKNIANDLIGIADILGAIDLNEQPDSFSLLNLVSSDCFQESLLDFFSGLSLNQTRKLIVQEALLLHKKRFYAGATCLLYATIEGVITECLVMSGKTISKAGNLYYKGETNEIYLSGLKRKFSYLKKEELSLKESNIHKLEDLYCFEFVHNDQGSTIKNLRDEFLHGSRFDFAEKGSAQLILWLFSLLLHLQLIQAEGSANE